MLRLELLVEKQPRWRPCLEAYGVGTQTNIRRLSRSTSSPCASSAACIFGASAPLACAVADVRRAARSPTLIPHRLRAVAARHNVRTPVLRFCIRRCLALEEETLLRSQSAGVLEAGRSGSTKLGHPHSPPTSLACAHALTGDSDSSNSKVRSVHSASKASGRVEYRSETSRVVTLLRGHKGPSRRLDKVEADQQAAEGTT